LTLNGSEKAGAPPRCTRYRLTEHGQTLLASVTDVEGAVDAVERRVASFDDKDAGPVRVTRLVTVGQRILKSGLLEAFRARHPGTIVELLMEQRMLDLSKGEADVAIRGGTPGLGALVGRKIAELPWGIYASRAFVERHGRPDEPRDIERFTVVELIDELKNLPAVRWMSFDRPRRPDRGGVIEIVFGCGARVRLRGEVGPETLRQVIELLR
jgi:DNA-binding transcriptional LysR family regulator